MSPYPWLVARARLTETVRHNVRRWAVARGHDLDRFRGERDRGRVAQSSVVTAYCRNRGCRAAANVDHNAYRGSAITEECPWPGA